MIVSAAFVSLLCIASGSVEAAAGAEIDPSKIYPCLRTDQEWEKEVDKIASNFNRQLINRDTLEQLQPFVEEQRVLFHALPDRKELIEYYDKRCKIYYPWLRNPLNLLMGRLSVESAVTLLKEDIWCQTMDERNAERDSPFH